MNTIHNNKQTNNEIKSRFALKGTTARSWAMLNGYKYSMVHQVIAGTVGKMQSPITIAFKIKEKLKADGFWPPEENNDPPAS